MPELIMPNAAMHTAWLAARADWGRGVRQDGAGLRPEDDVDSVDGFAAWVSRLVRQEDTSVPAAEGEVRCSYRWIVEDGRVLGATALRHELTERLEDCGGHIGYGVRPSARRRGVATWALGAVLAESRARGMTRVLLTCAVDNLASARVIERNGGVLDDVRETGGGVSKRYWITL